MALARQLLNGKIYVPRGSTFNEDGVNQKEVFMPRIEVDFKLLSNVGWDCDGVTVDGSFYYSAGQSIEELERYYLGDYSIEPIASTGEGINVDVSYPDKIPVGRPNASFL